MIAETDINESLKILAQDCEAARLYSSPPDGLVMRAIELGKGTRADLRRATGFGYDVIEKCLERLSGEISFQTIGGIERFYVGSVEPHVATQKQIEQMVARGKYPPETTSNGDSVIHESVNRNFEVFDSRREPTQMTHGHVGKYGISVGSEIKKIVEAMAVGWETDTPRLYSALVKVHPQLKDNPDQTGLRTYIAQAVSPLKGKLLTVVSKGAGGGHPDILCRIPSSAEPSKNGHDPVKIETKVRTEIAQPIVAEKVKSDKTQDTLPVKMTPQQFIERFNSFDDYEIDEFFTKLNEQSTDTGIVWGVLPEEPKHSKQFFSVAYNVLVTMLHDNMSEQQKDSVWRLICYMKRLQKDGFGG